MNASNGAGNETRTRDPDLGKVVLYQLSYSRARTRIIRDVAHMATRFLPFRAQNRPRGAQVDVSGPDGQPGRHAQQHFADMEQADAVEVLLVQQHDDRDELRDGLDLAEVR